MNTQTAAASLYATLVTYPADQRDAILVALCALQLAAVPGRGTAIVEPDKPVVDVPTVPDVVVDEKPTVGSFADGQEIKNWYGESIKARYKDGVLYATSGGADTFRDRGFLGQIGLTPEQVALFADSDPRSTAPIDAVPDPPINIDQPATDSIKPNPKPTPTPQTGKQKQAGCQLFHQDVQPDGRMGKLERALYKIAAEEGGNLMAPALQWVLLEPTPGNFDMRLIDDLINLADELGCQLAFRYVLDRPERPDERNYTSFIRDEERQRDQKGNTSVWAGSVAASLECERVTAMQARVVQKTMQHIADRGKLHLIRFNSFAFNGFYECDYPTQSRLTNQSETTEQLFDYNELARKGFVRRMKALYKGNLAKACKHWKIQFASWDDLYLPVPPPTGRMEGIWAFNTPYLQDFFLSRSLAIVEWMDTLGGASRSVCPDTPIYSEHGSWHDALSIGRATPLLAVLLKNVQGVKQNDAPDFPIGLSTALSRMFGRDAANEVFCGYDGSRPDHLYTMDEIGSQIERAFKSGCDIVVMAGLIFPYSTEEQILSRCRQIFRTIKDRKLLDGPVTPVSNVKFKTTLRTILSRGGWWAWVNGTSLRREVEVLGENETKLVNIDIEDDMTSPT